MTEQEMIAVMQAKVDGKIVQRREIRKNENQECKWEDSAFLGLWDFMNYEYRVKPEEEPSISEEQKIFLEEQKKHGPYMLCIKDNCLYLPIHISYTGEVYVNGTEHWSFSLKKYFVWQDGTEIDLR